MGKQKVCRAAPDIAKSPWLCESKKQDPVRIREKEKSHEEQKSDEREGSEQQETWMK